MLILQKLNQWGNGQGFLIDKKTIDKLRLKIGDKVEYRIEKGQLLITPIRDNKLLTEDYLISQLSKNSFDELSEGFIHEELEF